MINNFSFITEKGLSLKINLSKSGNIFEGVNKDTLAEYYRANSSGLKWFNDSHEVTIFESQQYLTGFPTPDLKKVVVVYPIDNKKFTAPANAVIYDADGNIYLKLKTPKLISEIARQREPFMQYDTLYRLYFEYVGWSKVSDDLITVMRVGFDREYWELRTLNPETGEFGECLSSGRR
jgi:hypothetical protein